ncbi:hypothetical protein PRZ48_010810 [Zasmidium cellare]|uniref:Glycoside hydrolase family 43 protein n=1 Tax=Zasmidium cellare TaxID=395010 RepID=A0ABR0E9Q9_ZASCE|nr:hypothetical protein PRZ48_010810 [Zasmidium cellare]
MNLTLGLTLFSGLLGLATAQNSSSNTFTNPIVPTGADPWMTRYGGYYYLIYTTTDNITLWRSQELTDWSSAEMKAAFLPPENQPYSTDLWAPELHNIDDKWYIIFTADPNSDTPPREIDMLCTFDCPAVNHRMYVLEGSTSDPWTSNYTLKGELNGVKGQIDTYNQFAIDGTYFQHSSGLYHVYSCWYSAYVSWPANLCISKMSNPWTVESNVTERQIISVPTNPWEKTPFGRTENIRLSSNEGPEQLTNRQTGQQFIIYSAARSDNRNYCLGQLELVGDDPMNPSDWKKDNEGCVFYQNPPEKAYGVGHASFTTSPDGTEDWIVYHGMENPFVGWGARNVRAQKFTWNDDGTPNFPRPGYGPYEAPSGQNSSMKMF